MADPHSLKRGPDVSLSRSQPVQADQLAGKLEGLRVLDRRIGLIDVPLNDPSWAPDGRRVVGDTAADFPDVVIYDLATKQKSVIDQDLHDHGYIMWAAAWSPNGRVIALSRSFRGSGSEIHFHPVGPPRFRQTGDPVSGSRRVVARLASNRVRHDVESVRAPDPESVHLRRTVPRREKRLVVRKG
ncbi:MAG TPA: hypothetical protein VF055_13370, partial [Steroidobacteraceae bacterium]